MNMNTKTILILTFILTLSFIPQVYADEENVNLMDLPKQLSERLGLPTSGDYFAGKLLASMILLIIFLFPTLFLCARFNKDVVFPAIFVGLTVLGFCVALGWFPVWSFVLIILLVAIIYANTLANIFGGKS